MANYGIAPASQAGVLNAVQWLERATRTSPYRFACQLGLSSEQARYQPATSAYLIAEELLARYRPAAPSASATCL